MRYIDNTNLNPSTNWRTLASAGETALRTSAIRTDIDKFPFETLNPYTRRQKNFIASEVWGAEDLQNEMLKLLYHTNLIPTNVTELVLKCWYSEKIEDREIFVDHFRPKGKIAELTAKNADLDANIWNQIAANSRNGYWFLTFDYKNYRMACKTVNQTLNPKPEPTSSKAKGKGAFFPLHINSNVAILADGIEDENIVLLDPCNQHDPELLRFNDLGKAIPSTSDVNSWNYCRAAVSIELYALNHHNDRITKKRLKVWRDTINLIKEIHAMWLGRLFNTDKYKAKNKELLKMTQRDSEFSAVAIDCIRQHQKTYIWLQTLFPSLTK